MVKLTRFLITCSQILLNKQRFYDSIGSKINLDIKAIAGSGGLPIHNQTDDINKTIKKFNVIKI